MLRPSANASNNVAPNVVEPIAALAVSVTASAGVQKYFEVLAGVTLILTGLYLIGDYVTNSH